MYVVEEGLFVPSLLSILVEALGVQTDLSQ